MKCACILPSYDLLLPNLRHRLSHACARKCVFASAHVRTLACIQAPRHTWQEVAMCVCILVPMHVHAHICMHVCTCVHAFTYVSGHACVYAVTYSRMYPCMCMNVYTYTYIHTHSHVIANTQEFATPIVKAKKKNGNKKQEVPFFTLQEYEEWRQQVPVTFSRLASAILPFTPFSSFLSLAPPPMFSHHLNRIHPPSDTLSCSLSHEPTSHAHEQTT